MKQFKKYLEIIQESNENDKDNIIKKLNGNQKIGLNEGQNSFFYELKDKEKFLSDIFNYYDDDSSKNNWYYDRFIRAFYFNFIIHNNGIYYYFRISADAIIDDKKSKYPHGVILSGFSFNPITKKQTVPKQLPKMKNIDNSTLAEKIFNKSFLEEF